MTSAPRVALAGVFHESNTFVPRATTLDAFRGAWHEGPDLIDALEGTQTVTGGFIAGARRLGFALRPAVHAWATPAGAVEPAAFNVLCSTLTRELQAVGPVDGVLLELHGAMVVEGRAAADAELARVVRAAVGDVPIVTVVDPHANVAPGLVDAVDVLIAYQTNPHVDMAERGEEAAALLGSMLAGSRPAQVAVRIPIVAPAIAQATGDEPLAELVSWTRSRAVAAGAAAASLAFGFAHADVPELGMTAIVAHDDARQAAHLARAIATRTWEVRQGFRRRLLSAEEAVELAAATPGVVALADTGDNVGGGAPGDSTVLAHALLAHGDLRAMTTICDPGAVAHASSLGEGATIDLVVGRPQLRLVGTVRALRDGRYVNDGPLSAGVAFDMGRVAIVDVGPLVVVLQSVAVMANDQNMLRSIGVDVQTLDAIVLKGAAAVRAGWASATVRIVDVGTPGPTTSDLATLPYQSISRPLWPLDGCEWSP